MSISLSLISQEI